MVMGQRAFIESAIAEVREAKDLVLPLLMVQEPEDPVTAASLRALWDQRETLDPVMRKTLALLMAYELPFIEEEARLEAEGLTLETDMAAFEVAMVDFERHFWEAPTSSTRPTRSASRCTAARSTTSVRSTS
jgi:hypothetical protein